MTPYSTSPRRVLLLIVALVLVIVVVVVVVNRLLPAFADSAVGQGLHCLVAWLCYLNLEIYGT